MFELIDKWFALRRAKRHESSSKKIARQASRAATRPGIHLDSMQAQRPSRESQDAIRKVLREAMIKNHREMQRLRQISNHETKDPHESD